LSEAGLAIETLEARLSTLSCEREEERRRLEEKLRQLEDDLGDSSGSASHHVASFVNGATSSNNNATSSNNNASFSATSTPNPSPSKSMRRKASFVSPDDEDEYLLHEVEEEMKRGEIWLGEVRFD
jgi:hypothetical protein